jgi:DNA-binding LacI/PurR family transcriptional regulator
VRLWQQLRPGTPVVALNATVEGVVGVARVYPDNAVGVDLALRRLAELGHSAVAFLSAPRGLVADPDRLRHFRRLARELGVRPNVMHAPLTITDVRRASATLLARRDAPTAIITNSDYTALGVYLTARDLSLRIGPDVSVIGHDDLPTSELLDPPLATLRLDGREMGRALMARLLDADRSDDYVAPVELVERASLQPPRIVVHRVPAAVRAATG